MKPLEEFFLMYDVKEYTPAFAEHCEKLKTDPSILDAFPQVYRTIEDIKKHLQELKDNDVPGDFRIWRVIGQTMEDWTDSDEWTRYKTSRPECFKLIHDMAGYQINHPDLPLTNADIKERLTEDQFKILLQHATCLACLAGNAFGGEFTEQYCLDAYVNLWQNSHVGGEHELPNLFGVSAVDHYCKRDKCQVQS